MSEEDLASLREIAKGFAMAVSAVDSKASQLGVFDNAGIGLELDELANLTARLIRVVNPKK